MVYYLWEEFNMCKTPFIDWNGNGQIDPEDIAVTLAIRESEDEEEEEE